MITSIISMVVVGTIMAHKPVAQAVERVMAVITAKKEEKALREEAMRNYLSREIMDIEH